MSFDLDVGIYAAAVSFKLTVLLFDQADFLASLYYVQCEVIAYY